MTTSLQTRRDVKREAMALSKSAVACGSSGSDQGQGQGQNQGQLGDLHMHNRKSKSWATVIHESLALDGRGLPCLHEARLDLDATHKRVCGMLPIRNTTESELCQEPITAGTGASDASNAGAKQRTISSGLRLGHAVHTAGVHVGEQP